MRIGLIILTVLTFTFLVSFIILAEPLGRCDPISPPLTGIDIEGAHIVSEGAYFRFWISNNNSFPVNVMVHSAAQVAANLVVPPNSSIDYDVIAPQISGVYERVTYKFSLAGPTNASEVDFTVLVLNSSFVQIFNLSIPILAIIAVIIIALAAMVIVRRRRIPKKT